MTDYKPQTQPGTIRRLSFETIGGDDYDRFVRTEKGIAREILTPKFSVPYSREGSQIHEYVDRNAPAASVAARNDLTLLIVLWYSNVKLKRALLSYISDNTIVRQLFEIEYIRDAPAVKSEVFNNG